MIETMRFAVSDGLSVAADVGGVPGNPAVVLLHGGVLMLGLGWLAKRNANWTLRAALRGNRRQADLPKAPS